MGSENIEKVSNWAEKLKTEIGRVILGKDPQIEMILTALLCGGHILLEDVPGVGKTILARALAAVMGGNVQRIQGTPDLLPSDILGASVYNPQSGLFRFSRGPIFSQIILMDEINRTAPQCQAALLQAMEEGAVSLEGKSLSLGDFFLLIATENPLDFEGTYELPQAQRDRFFLSLSLGYPDRKAEGAMLTEQNRLSHPVDDLKPVSSPKELLSLRKLVEEVEVPLSLENRILDITERSRKDERLELGASPRAARALYKGVQARAAIQGRPCAAHRDLTKLAVPVLRGKIKLSTPSLLSGLAKEDIIGALLSQTEVGELSHS
ncbi:MAG: MoxR family ATPase [Spirochaetales bacterium]|nr:MoxR family ATPase [Spirochaetales bacterium]